MPNVKIFHSHEMLRNGRQRAALADMVAEIVAAALDCSDYKGAPIKLGPKDIDVILMPFDRENARLGTDMTVEVSGYDYPDRMHTINARVIQIKEKIATETNHSVSVCFFPVSEGCWA